MKTNKTYEKIKNNLLNWKNDYIAVTTTAVAETFFLNGETKIIYKCRRCGRVVINTQEALQLIRNNKIEELRERGTSVYIRAKGLLVCSKCYKELKNEIKFYERIGNNKKASQLLHSISLKEIETKEFRKARIRAYRYLERMLKEGYFKYKTNDGKHNLYFF